MKKIFKYPLKLQREQVVILPKDADILSVQTQHQNICVWAMIDPNVEKVESKTIETFGTGDFIPEGERRYISTIQLNNGELVYHVFVKGDLR